MWLLYMTMLTWPECLTGALNDKTNQQKQYKSDLLVAYRHMSALVLVLLECKVQCLYLGTVFAEPEARRREGCHVCHYLSQTDIFSKGSFSD